MVLGRCLALGCRDCLGRLASASGRCYDLHDLPRSLRIASSDLSIFQVGALFNGAMAFSQP